MATLVSERNVAHASRAGAHSYGYQSAVNEYSRPSYMPASYRPGTSQGGRAGGGSASGFEAATVASLAAAASASTPSSSSSSSGSDTGSDSDLTADAKPFRRGQRQHVNGYYTPKRSARPGGGLSSEGKYSAPHHRQRQQLEQQQRRQQQQQQRRGVGSSGQQHQQQQLMHEMQKGQVQLLPKTYVEPDGKTHYLTEQERVPRLTPAGQVIYITRYAENVPNLRIAQ